MYSLRSIGRVERVIFQVFKLTQNNMCWRNLSNTNVQLVRSPSNRVSSFYDRYVFPEPPKLISKEEHGAVINKVNECIENSNRLFAIIHIAGKQYKITTHDLISIKGYLPIECGEKIIIEKVLLVGGTDFTLVGRPLLTRNIVKIEATVVEKTPEIPTIIKKITKNHKKTYKNTVISTVLRINSINVKNNLS